jgi:putative transposase
MLKSKKEREIMIDKNERMSISKQCELLELNRNFLYYFPKGENDENLEMMKIIDKQYFLTPFYGCRKITILLQNKGFVVNRKKVKRLMNLVNWRTIYREPKTTQSNPEHKKYPYLLGNLEITHRNQVWATDITYIPLAKGFMYLLAIIDLHTRCVLRWDLSNTMTAQWCADNLQEAINIHGKPEIFNTDQGSQYTSDIHTKVLIDNKIQISMDGKGRAIDNIFIERLWRTVKYENVYLQAYSDGAKLYKGLENYFEFYNTERFHQSINYKTPASLYYLDYVA